MAELQEIVDTIETERSAQRGASFLERETYWKKRCNESRRVDHLLVEPRDILLNDLQSRRHKAEILVDRELRN